LLFRRQTRLTGPWLELNSKPQPLHASHSTAHGAQVIRPVDYTGRLKLLLSFRKSSSLYVGHQTLGCMTLKGVISCSVLMVLMTIIHTNLG